MFTDFARIDPVTGLGTTLPPLPARDYDFSVDSLRQSVGVAVEWLAPLGTFRFSYALPFNVEDDLNVVDAAGQRTLIRAGDELERFQFSIGRSF